MENNKDVEERTEEEEKAETEKSEAITIGKVLLGLFIVLVAVEFSLFFWRIFEAINMKAPYLSALCLTLGIAIFFIVITLSSISIIEMIVKKEIAKAIEKSKDKEE